LESPRADRKSQTRAAFTIQSIPGSKQFVGATPDGALSSVFMLPATDPEAIRPSAGKKAMTTPA